MSVKSRKNVIEELVMEVLEIKNGHATKLRTISPTSGHVYTIELKPFTIPGGYGFHTTCQSNFGECAGNTSYVCKHSLAAVLHRIKAQGKMLYKCDSLEIAGRLNRIHKGTIIKITSQRGIAWGIVTSPEIETKGHIVSD